MKTEQTQEQGTEATDGKVMLADVQRLIELHGDINSLTLMRALRIPYTIALDAIIQFEGNGTIERKRNGRYRLNNGAAKKIAI